MKSWKEKFAERKLDFVVNHPLASKITTSVHLEIGKTQLFSSEFEKLAPGDYLTLDSCSYEPDSDKGRLMLTLDGRPLFRAKLKQGSLKILEFPLYPEDLPMKEDVSMKDEEDDEQLDSELDFETEETDLTEDEQTEHDLTDHDIDTTEHDAETMHDEDEHTEHDEEEFSEHGELTNEHLKDTEAQKKSLENKPVIPSEEPVKKNLPQKEVSTEKKGKLNIADLPVNVVIEIGRIQLSVQKIMELQPGNMLEVDIHPENGVDLVVNGKRMGKGELIRIGETIGIRILDLG